MGAERPVCVGYHVDLTVRHMLVLQCPKFGDVKTTCHVRRRQDFDSIMHCRQLDFMNKIGLLDIIEF